MPTLKPGYFALLLLLAACAPARLPEPRPEPPTLQTKLRGVWLTNVDSEILFSPEALDAAMARLAARGFNDAGVVVVRLHNTADAPRRARLTLGIAVTEARRTDLREVWAAGEPLPLDGNTLALDLGPHQIATMLLRTHSL